MKNVLLLTFAFFSFFTSYAQLTTFSWNGTFGGSGASRTFSKTTSGITVSATIVNSENVFQNSSPVYIASGSVPPGSGCSGISATNQGMLLSTDWTSNATKTITVTVNFSSPVQGPVDFSLYDINDDGFGSWLDKVVISGTNASGNAVNVSKVGTLCIQTGGTVTGNNSTQLTLNSGSSSSCTCYGNNEINVGTSSDCISTVTIKYQSATGSYNNPSQYIIISDLKATIAPTVTAPTSITGTTSICSGQSTTLTAVGGSASSIWYAGSCSGTSIGTGSSITVSPTTTTTYYVQNPASGTCSVASACASTTVTVNASPSIAAKTASICSGSSYTFSSAVGDVIPSGTTYSWSFVDNTFVTGESTGTAQSGFTQTLTNTSNLPQTVAYSVTPTGNGCSGTPFTISLTVDAPLNGGTISTDQTICSGQTPNLLNNVQSASGGSGLGLANSVQIGSQIWMNTNLDVLNYTDGQVIGTDFTVASGAYTWYNNDQPTYGVYAPLYNWFAVNTNKLCPSGWRVPTNADWLTLMNYLGSNQGNKLKSCRQVSSPLGGTCDVTALPRWDSHVSQYGTDNVGFSALPAGRKEISNFLYTGTRATFWSADNYTPGINGSSYYVNIAYNLATAEYSDFIDYYTSSRWGLSVRCMAGNTNNVNSSYTYQWQQDPGCTGNWTNISGATSTTYQPGALSQTTCFRRVTVDATCGNAYSNTVTITVNSEPTPTITASGSTTFCQGNSVTLTSSATTGNAWSNGATTQSITVSTSGTYSVTVTGANGCSATSASTSVTVNSNPTTPTISASGATTFCQGGSVTLTSSAASGNTWSTGETTQSIVVSTSGTYSVSVSNASGCTASSDSTDVVVKPVPATPTISTSGAMTFCQGGSVTLTSSAVSGNTWSTSETTQSIVVTSSGTYSVTVSGANGCSATSASTSVTVNSNPTTPTISASGATTFCQGGSVTLTSSAASGNTWSTGETTQSIVVSTSGTYSVTVSNASGCTASSASTDVVVNPFPATPTISTSGATTFCQGGSVTLTSSALSGNTWSTNETTQSIVVTNSGTYSVTVSGANGCSATSASTSVTVNSNPTTPTISASGATTFCQGGSVTLTSSAASGNTWSTGATTQSIVVSSSGTYSVTVSDVNGCSSTSSSTVVTVNPNVTTQFTQVGAICSGGSFSLPTTSINGISGTWSPAINTSATTTYTFTPSAGQCGTSTTMTVTVTPSVTPTFNQVGPFCAPTTIASLPTTSLNGIYGTWSPAINNTSTTTYTFTPSISPGADCDLAANICDPTTTYVISNLNGGGANNDEGEPGSCMDVPGPNEQNSAWLIFTAATSGNLTFDIIPSDPTDDVDFILYQLNSDNPCGSRTVLRCNASACTTLSGHTGLSMTDTDLTEDSNCDPGENAYCQYVQATAGTKYALMINNCNTNQSVSLQFNNGIPNPVSFATADAASTYYNATTCNGQCATTTTMTIQVNNPVVSTTNLSICPSQLPYTWNSLTFTTAGTQTDTLVASNGCDSLATLNLSIFPEPSVSEVITNVTCNSGSDGAVVFTLQTGLAPFTINPIYTTNLIADTYIYQITDANGCQILDTVIISEPPAIIIAANYTDATCATSADGAIDLHVSGGVTPYTYNWSNGATSQDVSGLLPGNYSVDITDNVGCITNFSVSVGQSTFPTPTISLSGPTTFCQGDSVVLTSSATTGNTWSTGATSQSITVSSSGTCSVTVDSSGCSATSASVTITVNPIPTTPTISASGATTFCSGDSVVLTSSATTGNTWSTGAATQSITVTTSGSYSVTVDSNACTASSTPIVVTVNPSPVTPTISLSGPTTFCQGDSVVLTSSSTTGNTWSTGATTQSITVSSSGTYSVTVDSSGCSATSANVTITVNPIPTTPTISASGTTTFCSGDSVILTSSAISGNTWSTGATTQSITVTTSGSYSVTVDSNACTASSTPIVVTVNPSPVTPTISLSGPTTFCQGDSVVLTSSSTTGNTWSTVATTQSITVSSSGTYSVTVDSSACSATSASVTITVNPIPTTPTISASGASTFCSGDSVVLTSSAISGNTWSTGATTQSITVSTSGSYSVTVDSNACTAISTPIVITVNPSPVTPTISLSGPTTFCQGDSVVLTSSSTTGNTWSTGATTQSITVSSSGTYSVTVDSSACSATSASVTITVNPIPTTPTISASGATTFCSGDSVVLTSSAISGNTWSTGATTQSITVTTSGSYSVTVDSNACTASSTPIVVIVNPSPVTPTISLSGPTTFCQGDSVVLTSSSTTGNTWSTGATTQSITVLSSGTYSVTVDSSGCSATSASVTVTVNPIPTTPTILASGPTTFCQGGNVTLTSSATIGNTWSTGATTQSITVSTSGNYSVTVSASGCTATSAGTSVTVNPAPATPTVSASGATTFCQGGNVTLTSSATTGNTWSTGATTQSISVSSSGIYSVTVDSSGCSATSASVTITVNPIPPTPTISASGPTTFCQGGNVTLTSSATIGNTWSTGATTQSITVSTSGNYSVTVSASGCTATSAGTSVTVNPAPATPTVSASGATTFCQGGNVTLTSSATTGNTWSTGATTQSITVSASGTYSVTVNSGGCSATSTATTVTVNPVPNTPTVSASGPTTFCQGGSVTLTSSATTGNLWSNSATTQSITVTTSGTYSLLVSNNGCSAPSVSITTQVTNALPTPTVSASGPTTFCQGGSVTLTSSATTGNTWSTGATTQSITVSASGSYSVTVNSGGCSATSTATSVTVNPVPNTPTVSASGATTFCQGGSVTLISSATTGNLWSTGATTQSITVTTSGNYSVTLSASGCSATSAGTSVTVNPAPATPTITASGPTTFCQGGNITLTSSASTGNTWSTGATTQSITVSASGTYSVSVNSGGCSATSTATSVTVNPVPNTPTVSASGATTFCQGGSVTLTSSATTGNLWSTGATTQSITVSTSGNYSVTVNASGCTATSAGTNVTVNPAPATPTVSASGPTTFCQGGSVTLTSSATTGNTWSTGATTQSITVSASGTYTVTVNSGGCSATSTATSVTVNPTPTANITSLPVSGCAPLNVQFVNQGANPNATCVWTLSNGQTITGCSNALTLNNGGCLDVTLTTTLAGCTSTQTIPNYACVTPGPTAMFNANPSVFNSSTENIQFYNNSVGATSYQWQFGDGNTSTVFSPTHNYSNTENGYTVTLIASDANGCTDEYEVSIGYIEGVEYYIPNTFTPDGDGYNQTFQPVFTSGFDPYNYHMMIFDRWGELIFESYDAHQGWDGSLGYEGLDVQDGIYTYKIVFKSQFTDKRYTVVGHVTLIR